MELLVIMLNMFAARAIGYGRSYGNSCWLLLASSSPVSGTGKEDCKETRSACAVLEELQITVLKLQHILILAAKIRQTEASRVATIGSAGTTSSTAWKTCTKLRIVGSTEPVSDSSQSAIKSRLVSKNVSDVFAILDLKGAA